MELYHAFLQWFVNHSCNQQNNYTYNHCLYTVQAVLNFAAGSFCCKITLIWLGSSLSVYKLYYSFQASQHCCNLIRFFNHTLTHIRVRLTYSTHKLVIPFDQNSCQNMSKIYLASLRVYLIVLIAKVGEFSW